MAVEVAVVAALAVLQPTKEGPHWRVATVVCVAEVELGLAQGLLGWSPDEWTPGQGVAEEAAEVVTAMAEPVAVVVVVESVVAVAAQRPEQARAAPSLAPSPSLALAAAARAVERQTAF